MKIGIFDSGLGGLLVAHSFVEKMPTYDYMYLGDTLHVPYGDRTQDEIYAFTLAAVQYLFVHDCQLIILACNTASAKALREIQQSYLPKHYPDRRVLGVLIPAAQAAVAVTKNNVVGIVATKSTVDSGAFVREVHKLNPRVRVVQKSAAQVVPLVEQNKIHQASQAMIAEIAPMLAENLDTLILGSTHYPFVKAAIRQFVGPDVAVICQDELLAPSLLHYLQRHPEIEQKITKNTQREFLVTHITPATQSVATRLFGGPVLLKQVSLVAE